MILIHEAAWTIGLGASSQTPDIIKWANRAVRYTIDVGIGHITMCNIILYHIILLSII